jgi:hypothetical protein
MKANKKMSNQENQINDVNKYAIKLAILSVSANNYEEVLEVDDVLDGEGMLANFIYNTEKELSSFPELTGVKIDSRDIGVVLGNMNANEAKFYNYHCWASTRPNWNAAAQPTESEITEYAVAKAIYEEFGVLFGYMLKDQEIEFSDCCELADKVVEIAESEGFTIKFSGEDALALLDPQGKCVVIREE